MAHKKLNLNEKKGLWANIHAKRARGEKMNPKGHPDAPSSKEMKMAQEAIQRRMDRMVIIATDPATGRKVVKIAPKKEIEIGKGKQESYELENYMEAYFDEYFSRLDEQQIAIINDIPEEIIEEVVEYVVENDLQDEEITEQIFTEEAQQLDEILPALVGLARVAGMGYKAYRKAKKFKAARAAAGKSTKGLTNPLKKGYQAMTNPANVKKGMDSVKGMSQGKAAWKIGKGAVQGGWKATKKILGGINRGINKVDPIPRTRWVTPKSGSLKGIPQAITKGHMKQKGSMAGNIGKTYAAYDAGALEPIKGAYTYLKTGKTPGQIKKETDALFDKYSKKPSTKPKTQYASFDPRSMYNFETDLNENIIGASFAKGDNQGNFNNEVNAVRDALAQIQELSPQTISSYQKKAGKQYRQAKGERPMHPEYAAGLNAAGKMTDKDMEDSDKAYDIMKKRGKGLAMSKGKGKVNEQEVAKAPPMKKGPSEVAKAPPMKTTGPGEVAKAPAPKPGGPSEVAKAPAPKPGGPSESKFRLQKAKPKSSEVALKVSKGPSIMKKITSEGAMKELVTKKQENERLAKRKKDSEYSDKDVRMGKGVAFDKRYKGGNMTGAYKTINKIKKGLGDHPKVADALRRANEEFNNEGERNG